MKNIRVFLSENVHFLVVKFSIYLNRRVFVMCNDGPDQYGHPRSLIIAQLKIQLIENNEETNIDFVVKLAANICQMYHFN